MRLVQVDPVFSVLEMRGGTHLAIRHDPALAAGPVPWDLMVDDLDDSPARWREGGLAPGQITDGGPHRSFEITDPDGHVIGVRDSHVIGPGLDISVFRSGARRIAQNDAAVDVNARFPVLGVGHDRDEPAG